MPANNCTANVSRRHKYGFSTSGATTLSKQVAMLSFAMKSNTNYAKDEGVRGHVWSRDEDFVIDKTDVNGSVSFNARAIDMRWFLPLVMGTAFSGDVIKAGPQCPFFRVGHLDSVQATIFTYIDCSMNKVTFSSSDAQGGLLNIAADIVACQSTQSASGASDVNWPTMSLAGGQPLSHSQSTLTLNGVTTRIKDAQVVIDNALLTDGFFNSRYRGDAPSDNQTIQLIHTSPFDAATDLALLNLTGPVAATLVYTGGPYSITFSFPNLRAIPTEPEVGGRGSRITNQVTWEAALIPAANIATDSPLTITLDDTP